MLCPGSAVMGRPSKEKVRGRFGSVGLSPGGAACVSLIVCPRRANLCGALRWCAHHVRPRANGGSVGAPRGFARQGAQVFRFQIMDIALAARPGQDLYLRRGSVKPIGNALGPRVDVEPFRQLRILRGDAHGTTAGMTMMTGV